MWRHLAIRWVVLVAGIVVLVGSQAWTDEPKTKEKTAGPGQRKTTDQELERRAARYAPLVQDFYEYDIGVLRGRRGQQVRSRWRQLKDPAAIPALVHGLNRAMRQGASCPIVAFSAKLRELLARADQPELGEYVLRHLRPTAGPFSYHVRQTLKAAHDQVIRTKSRAYGRLQLLRRMRKRSEQSVAVTDRSLLELIGGSAPTAAPRPAASVGDEDSVARTVSALANGTLSSDELRALEHMARGPEASRLVPHVSRLMTAAANPRLPRDHRTTAVRVLGRLRVRAAVPVLIDLVAGNDEKLRQEAATALTRITRRVFGPAPGATPEQIQASVRRWRAWWAEQQRDESPMSKSQDH